MGLGVGPILIVDGDARFGAFVRRLFGRAGFSTTEARTGSDALAAVRRERPSVVLLEVSLPDSSGFEIAYELREECGDDLPIIFVSGDRTEPADRTVGLLIGGDDYIVKPADPDELVARTRRLITRAHRAPMPRLGGSGDALTPRELEVLELLAEGLGSKEIARRLVVSPKTVASHVQHLLGKLGVHTRAEAIVLAYRDGFVARSAPHTDDNEPSAAAHI